MKKNINIAAETKEKYENHDGTAGFRRVLS